MQVFSGQGLSVEQEAMSDVKLTAPEVTSGCLPFVAKQLL